MKNDGNQKKKNPNFKKFETADFNFTVSQFK